MEKLTKNCLDLSFTIVAEPEEYLVKYTIFDIEGIEADGTPLFYRKGGRFYSDSTRSVEEADIYLHGYVRWDGCSNWHFDEQDNADLHGCSRQDLMRIGEILTQCWDWTAKLCPNWSV